MCLCVADKLIRSTAKIYQWLCEFCSQKGKDKSAANKGAVSDDDRSLSKILSDYMIYLLVQQPKMMSTVAGIGKIRYQGTCVETINFFSRRGMKEGSKIACDAIPEVDTEVKTCLCKGR